MIKVSDLVAKILFKHGIRHVFMVTGGGAMHLNDSLGKHEGLEFICCHHEQACAMAAESYARLTGRIAAVNVTTGPGGINALNGVFGAYTDSIPMIIISGQVRYDTTVQSTGLNLRQLGDQEYAKIIDAANTMTKYATTVIEANEVGYHIEKAIFLSTHGRPGPTWIDIPMNIQGAYVDEEKLKQYSPNEDSIETPKPVGKQTIHKIIDLIKNSHRPVILAGSGIRISHSQERFLNLVNLLNIPVTTAWNAHDIIQNDNRLYFGRPGSIGDRPGNFIVQNSDLLIVLGCRLNIRQIGYNYQTFAREAYKIIVDIDPIELEKPTVKPDFPICADVAELIDSMLAVLDYTQILEKKDWVKWCNERKEKYPVVLPEYTKCENVNPYCFVDELFKQLDEDQIIVTGDGTACVVTFQAAAIKRGQRLYTNSGCASMGYDLPAAIGACIGSEKKKIICLAGDGSIQMNLQELATISYNRMPIKIFVLNNNGYHSIRQTQKNFFGEPFIGVGPESGLGFFDMQKLAEAFHIPYLKCSSNHELKNTIKDALQGEHATICEIFLNLDQQFSPKLSSQRLADGRMVSKPLEDMAPFLPREEFLQNMIIKPLEE